MEVILELVKIVLALFVLHFLGLFLLKNIFKVENIFPLEIVIALVNVAVIVFLGRYIQIPMLLITLGIILCSIYSFWIYKRDFKFKISVSFFLVLVISFVYASNAFFEGFKSDGSLVILGPSYHDSLWHFGLQNSLEKSIPPQNPIYSGEYLYNYHYFTDIFLIWIKSITGISIYNLYLHWLPLILSFLFVSTTLCVFQKLCKSKINAYLATGLVVFGSGFSYLAPFLYSSVSSGQSVFWLDQPLRYLTNQQLVLSLIVVNTILYFYLSSYTKNWLIIGLLLGVLSGIKVYALLIYLPVLAFVSLIHWKKNKDISLLKSVIIGSILSGIIIFLESKNSGFPFILEPGWFVKTMYESKDHLNYSTWEIHRILYLETHNYLRLIIHWLWGIGIFLIGNFGVKILGLVFLIAVMIRYKSFKNVLGLYFLFGMIVGLSILYPMIFLQKGVVWNTIQFMHFAQLPLVIIVVLLIEKLFPSKRQYLILSLFLILSLPTSFFLIADNFSSKSYNYVSADMNSAMKSLSDLEDKKILVGASFNQDSIVPALSGKPVLYADSIILNILRINYQSREKMASEIEQGVVPCILDEYLVLAKGQERRLEKTTRVIYQNNSVVILECKN